MEVKVNGFLKTLGVDYIQVNDHAVQFKYLLPAGAVVTIRRTRQESHFADGAKLGAWYKDAVISMENERTRAGEPLIEGVLRGGQMYFDGEAYMTRAQAIVLLNRFRKWAIETFKG
ncbi:hypothetical protein [Aneurinibacillus thermoaerophilus]|uniref:hypothetical protein n=1 Tax=Aneurinibacillus thermoaerophilus TaxID=143495 RepID=UPI002E1C9571|nr:hypothetical protein [Aneurinibacillus thermoaerophilus]